MKETKTQNEPNPYKFLIYIKGNRKFKRKTKFLTHDLTFDENENKALNFQNYETAEQYLKKIKTNKTLIHSPKILIKQEDGE